MEFRNYVLWKILEYLSMFLLTKAEGMEFPPFS
jgi:hypothetical protein